MFFTGYIRGLALLGYLFQCIDIARAAIQTMPIGHLIGSDNWSPEVVKEIGLSVSGLILEIRINGKAHGDSHWDKTAEDKGSITLNRDEYICKIEYLAGKPGESIGIYKFRITTNTGRTWGHWWGKAEATTLENIRVLGIGGSASNYVTKLNIMYVDNYQPSMREATNVGFIISYSPPYEEFEEFTDTNFKTLDSFQKVTERMMTQTYSPSIEAEFYVKIQMSSSLEIKDTNTVTIKKEIEKELKSGKKIKRSVPAGHVGVKMVIADLMKGADGTFWMFPNTEVSYSVINQTEIDGLLGFYDLTGTLYTQMQKLKPYKVIQNGYVYYRDPNKK